jgi:hypothetical protein
LSSELFPCIAILLIPVVQELSLDTGGQARILTALFVITGGVSVAMHLRGATAWPGVNDWNIGPPDINTAPGKVWQWRDPQFLKGLDGGLATGL